MRVEIASAANFLSNLLSLHTSRLSPNQLDAFRAAMETLLNHHYQQHWFPEKPFKGSGYRCLRINHKMDPIIARAGHSCGLPEEHLRTLFPNELSIWIDPREVSYRIGENGSICVLYDADADPEPQPVRHSPMSSSPVSSSSTCSLSSPSSGSDWFMDRSRMCSNLPMYFVNN